MLSAPAAVVRWLAVLGHALIAGYVVLSLLVSVVLLVVVVARDGGGPFVVELGFGLAVSGLLGLWLASRARRLWQTYDASRFLGALPGDIFVVLWIGASALVGVAGGQPILLVLVLVAVPAGVAVLTLASALLLPRPVADGP